MILQNRLKSGGPEGKGPKQWQENLGPSLFRIAHKKLRHASQTPMQTQSKVTCLRGLENLKLPCFTVYPPSDI